MAVSNNNFFTDKSSVLSSPSGSVSRNHRHSLSSQSVHSDSALDDLSILLSDRDTPSRSIRMRSSAEIDRIIVACTSKLKSEPRNVRALYLRGSMLLKRGEYETSRQDFSYILQFEPNHIGSLYSRGMSFYKQGLLNEAITDFSTVLQKDSTHVNAVYARAACYNAIGDFAGAIEDYNLALMRDQEKTRQLSLLPEKRPDRLRSMSSDSVGLMFDKSDVEFDELVNQVNGSDSNNSMRNVPEAASTKPKTVSLSNGFKPVSGQTADECFARGFALRKNGDFKGAIEAYSQALHIDSSHFKSLFNRGFAYDKLGLFHQAISDYSRVIDDDKSNPFAFYNRGISYDKLDSLLDAISDFSSAIQLLPTNADFWHNRGFCQRKIGNYREAIIDYSNAIQIVPNHFKSLYNRAYCCEKLGNFSDALVDYNKAIELKSDNSNVYHNRGMVLERLGNLEGALADFNRSISLCDSQANGEQQVGMDGASNSLVSSLHARALVLDKLNRSTEALVDYDKLIEGDDDNAMYRLERGICLRSCGRLEESIRDFSMSIQLNPSNAAAYNNRGFVWRRLGRFDLAVKDYSRAIEVDGSNLRVLNNRAYCFAKIGQFQMAIDDYSGVILLDPSNSHAYHNRGISYSKLNLNDQASKDFSKVVEIESIVSRNNNSNVSQSKLGSVVPSMQSPGRPDVKPTPRPAVVRLSRSETPVGPQQQGARPRSVSPRPAVERGRRKARTSDVGPSNATPMRSTSFGPSSASRPVQLTANSGTEPRRSLSRGRQVNGVASSPPAKPLNSTRRSAMKSPPLKDDDFSDSTSTNTGISFTSGHNLRPFSANSVSSAVSEGKTVLSQFRHTRSKQTRKKSHQS